MLIRGRWSGGAQGDAGRPILTAIFPYITVTGYRTSAGEEISLKRTVLALAGVLTATALVLTTGCAGGSDDPSGSVELTYWSWAPNLDKVVETWNATYPDIHTADPKQYLGTIDDAATRKVAAFTPT